MKASLLALPFVALALSAAPQLIMTTTAQAQAAPPPNCYYFGNKMICPSKPEVPEARVCFYIDTDFSDRHFCEAGSRTVNDIRANESWKHGVESIEIGKGSKVKVCSEPDMKGECQLYGDSIRELPPALLNKLYSYRTMRNPFGS